MASMGPWKTFNMHGNFTLQKVIAYKGSSDFLLHTKQNNCSLKGEPNKVLLSMAWLQKTKQKNILDPLFLVLNFFLHFSWKTWQFQTANWLNTPKSNLTLQTAFILEAIKLLLSIWQKLWLGLRNPIPPLVLQKDTEQISVTDTSDTLSPTRNTKRDFAKCPQLWWA